MSVIFQHTTSTQPPLYRQISRLSDETTLHNCISDVPDGTYNISVIDSPSYDNKRYDRPQIINNPHKMLINCYYISCRQKQRSSSAM